MHAGSQSRRSVRATDGDQTVEVLTFTPRGQRTVDRMVDDLVCRAGTSTEGIADVLAEVLAGDLDALCAALDDAAADLEETTAAAAGPVHADKPAQTGVIWAEGWRQQLPGLWPHYPDDGHHCWPQGHWTRTGELVLACCGLDAT